MSAAASDGEPRIELDPLSLTAHRHRAFTYRTLRAVLLLLLRLLSLVAARAGQHAGTRARHSAQHTAAQRRRGTAHAEGATALRHAPCILSSISSHGAELEGLEAQALEAESALAAQRTRLLSEIRTAQSRELATSTQMQAASERQRLAQQTRTFYQKSFAMGETDMPTRLRIEQEATEAERAALLAKVEHAAAISSLLQAQGTLPQLTETFTDISGTR